MSKYNLLILSIIGVFFGASCQLTHDAESASGQLRQLMLHYTEVPLLDDTDTKTQVGNLSMKLAWKAGDAVAVYDETTQLFYKYELNPAYVGAENGAFDLAAGEATPDFGNHDLHAIYPYDAVSVEGGQLYIETFREREGGYVYSHAKTANEAFSLNDILITRRFKASSLSGVMSFSRMVSLLDLNITMSDETVRSETINKVTFKATGIAGKSPVIFSSGTPSLGRSVGTKDSFTITLTTAPRYSATDFLVRFVPMLPINTLQSETNLGFTFLVENDKYIVGFHRNRNQNFSSGGSTFLDLYEGFYTNRFPSESAAGYTHQSWWCVTKDPNAFNGEITPGVYQNGVLPGSGTGAYEDRPF